MINLPQSQGLASIKDRQSELHALSEWVEQARSEFLTVILIEGESGLGKTTLVSQCKERLSDKQTFFAIGKDVESTSPKPLNAILEVCSQLSRQILSLHRPDFWRNQIYNEFGAASGLLTYFIPEFRYFAESLPELDQQDDLIQNPRVLLYLLTRLISLFLDEFEQGVIVLDDVQWADTATFNLLSLWFTEFASRKLTLILLSRPIASPSKLDAIVEQAKTLSRFRHMSLLPFSLDQTKRHIQAKFSGNFDRLDEFAQVLHQKTKGNPLYLSQVLSAAFQQELIYEARDEWQWSTQGVEKIAINGDLSSYWAFVSSLVTPIQSQILSAAACAGFAFSADLVSSVLELPFETVLLELENLCQKDILFCNQSEGNQTPFSFFHDQIFQSFIDKIDPPQKITLHYRIGHFLATQENAAIHAIEIATHFLQAKDLIKKNGQTDFAARFLFLGALRSIRSTEYTEALHFLDIALYLAPSSSVLLFNIKLNRALAHYLMQDYITSESEYLQLIKASSAKEQRIRAYYYLIQQYTRLYQYRESERATREALSVFGDPIPGNRFLSLLSVARLFIKLIYALFFKPVRLFLDKPQLTEPVLLTRLSLNFYFSESINGRDRLMMALAVFRSADITFSYGNSYLAPLGYMSAAFILIRAGRFERASQFMDLAMNVSAKYPSPDLKGKLHCLYYGVLAPWKIPYTESLPYMRTAFSLCQQARDFWYSDASAYLTMLLAVSTGISMARLVSLYDEFEAYFSRHGVSYRQFLEYKRVIKLLLDEKAISKDIGTVPADLLDDERVLLGIRTHYLIFYFYCDDFDSTIKEYDKIKYLIPDGSLGIFSFEGYFYVALAFIREWVTPNPKNDRNYKKEIETIIKKFSHWATVAPHYYQAKSAFLRACCHFYLENDTAAAAEQLEIALEAAEKYENLQVKAIALEWAYQMKLKSELTSTALHYLKDAIRAYDMLGIRRKSATLRKLPSGADPEPDHTMPSENILPLESLFGVDMDDTTIFQSLMSRLFDRTKASKIILLELKDGQLVPQLIYNQEANEDISFYASTAPLPVETMLSNFCVNQAVSTATPIIVCSPYPDEVVQVDPYLQATELESISAVPIRDKSGVIGVVYLEYKQHPSEAYEGFVQGLGLLLLKLCRQNNVTKTNSNMRADYEKNNTLDPSFVYSSYVKGIGHEIRNPFFIIRLRAETILDNQDPESEVGVFARSVIANVDRVLEITDLMIKYINPDISNDARVILHELVSDIRTVMESGSQKVEIHWEIDVPDTLAVRGHKNHLYQTLYQIVTNSVEALENPEGTIRITAQETPDRMIELSISDNGKGISPQDLSKVFTIFFSTKYSHRGAGLTIAKEVIAALGGSINIESSLNQGTAVTIRLPAY